MDLYKTDHGFRKGVQAFTTSFAEINQRLHILLCSAIILAACKDQDHSPGTGDMDFNSRVGYLLENIPAGMRSKKVEVWLKKYAPINIKDDGTVTVISKKKRAAFHWDIKGMMETPFWELAENKAPKQAFDLHKALERVAKRAAKEGVTQDQFCQELGELINQAGTLFVEMKKAA